MWVTILVYCGTSPFASFLYPYPHLPTPVTCWEGEGGFERGGLLTRYYSPSAFLGWLSTGVARAGATPKS